MTKEEAEAMTTVYLATATGWALGVIEAVCDEHARASIHQQRAKETLKLVDKVLPDETA